MYHHQRAHSGMKALRGAMVTTERLVVTANDAKNTPPSDDVNSGPLPRDARDGEGMELLWPRVMRRREKEKRFKRGKTQDA
jgi:hypothetical protein